VLKVEKLNQGYGESHTLWDVDLDVLTGSCTCLMGRNGVGKTTLLKAIMGLLPTSSATITYDGNDLAGQPCELRAYKGMGYVPQGREIFTQLTVEENLRVGLLASGDGFREIPEFIFELFPALKQMLHRRGGDLF
jgi:urea transport system ATP-binding protein